MLLNLLRFEWSFWKGKKSFYAMLAFYLLLGFVAATGFNLPFPETNKNAPYVLTYIIGLLSLLCIFSTTILAALSLFRESESRFDEILFATPVRKLPYVSSRFLVIFAITLFCYFLFICGMITGHQLSAGASGMGPFHPWYYIKPYLLLLVPNILFCTAVACAIGMATRNKMLVYVSGVFIYFLYWGVAMYSNSPLIANSAPVSAEAMNWSARLDPFGIASFLQQSRYWTALQRNTETLHFANNVLINRLTYLLISGGLLLLAYRSFSMSGTTKKNKKRIPIRSGDIKGLSYSPVPTRTTGLLYHLAALGSLVKIECLNIIKTIPIWVISIGWMGFLGIEIASNMGGNSRIPPQLATTGQLIPEILSAFPLVGILVVLFYATEIFWRSRVRRFDALELTTAVTPMVSLLSKCLPLCLIIVLLISFSILVGIGCQLFFGSDIDWRLYLSLFYLLGLPLLLSGALIISIQAFVKNKYLGLTLAAIVLFITNTSVGDSIGLKHPMLKFAAAFNGNYSDMNAFGSPLEAFHAKMLYWLFVSTAILLLAGVCWQYKKTGWFSGFQRSALLMIGCLFAAITAAVFAGFPIYQQTQITSRNELNHWRQTYEQKYQHLKNKPQPTITDITTSIDLFPESESYQVNGRYRMVNKTIAAIDTIFIYGDRQVSWTGWHIENGDLVNKDSTFGYYTFALKKILQPGDTLWLDFAFHYQKSIFNASASFNTIVHNGSFIRISNYYPVPGYSADNEIDDPRERKLRQLPISQHVLPLDAPRTSNYGFVNIDATISTSGNQTAIGVGELLGQWKKENRNYFRYASSSPVPRRFAVASAAYAMKRLKQGNTNIELYYHPGHAINTEHILSVTGQTLDYGEHAFAPYALKTLRLVEISSFSKGFAGTAYPGSLFINESFGFQNKLDGNPHRDIIAEMVSHELSHEWWGNAGIAPDYREGSKVLTETLAMYTELMVYRKIYGEAPLAARVNVHKDIYLADRSSAPEEPLFLAHPDKPWLCYNKGMVVMYKLYQLLGEEKINRALNAFYKKHAFPNTMPVSTDLLNELYKVASKGEVIKIDEWFKTLTVEGL